MDPVARVWDVLDVSVGEQPLDFWVIIRAGVGQRRGEVKMRTSGLKVTERKCLVNVKTLIHVKLITKDARSKPVECR